MAVVENVVPAGAWSADATHSSVSFEVEHMGVSVFAARFTSFDAELASRDDRVELRGSVRADSVDIQDEVLRAHVLAADFLDAERYPQLTFRSTRFVASGGELVVHGDLTIKGTTKEVEAHGTITGAVSDPTDNVRVGLSVATTIDRKDFGLDFEMAMPDGSPALGSEVALVVSLELVKSA